MNEQEGAQALSKRRKTHLTSKQDRTQTTTPQPPANDNKKAWLEYWKVQGQHWRIEPEIDVERQKYLDESRSITPDIEQGIYPFKDIKLSRADVEWLLATHENGRGPVDWGDESQREREGLDMRGANLRDVNLSKLPLACMLGGAASSESAVVIHLEGADLEYAHLEGASLDNAHLERVQLMGAHLEEALLEEAHLERAYLGNAYLNGADLQDAHLEGAELYDAHLEDTPLSGVHLEGASLHGAYLKGATLNQAHL